MNGCAADMAVPPCTLVVFGASGDLTSRKLVPALYRLFQKGILSKEIQILGCGRTPMNSKEFRDKVKDAVIHSDLPEVSKNLLKWDDFEHKIHYQTIAYDSIDSIGRVSALVDGWKDRTQGNRLLYLAIPSSLYEITAEKIGQVGLGLEGPGLGWSRLVVEKPFGRDLMTARSLNQTLLRSFKEDQIFRMDHFLSKETVQNLLVFRFANSIFEPVWNRIYIHAVYITIAESIGIEHRAGYYEQAGIIRDMFQNHLMQLLALVAMEPPSRFEAEAVHDERAKLFRSLRPFASDPESSQIILGQYAPGIIQGQPALGYRQEAGVDPQSLIPTFAQMKVFVDNWRWQGVPFVLTSGKRLSRKFTNVVIQFREVPHSLFRNMFGESILANRLNLGVYPNEIIRLSFQAKRPGAKMCLMPVHMNFEYNEDKNYPGLDPYEKSILDCMLGDHSLFWRQDGIEQCWSFFAPVLESCENCRECQNRLHPYTAGGFGPEQVESFLKDLPIELENDDRS